MPHTDTLSIRNNVRKLIEQAPNFIQYIKMWICRWQFALLFYIITMWKPMLFAVRAHSVLFEVKISLFPIE